MKGIRELAIEIHGFGRFPRGCARAARLARAVAGLLNRRLLPPCSNEPGDLPLLCHPCKRLLVDLHAGGIGDVAIKVMRQEVNDLPSQRGRQAGKGLRNYAAERLRHRCLLPRKAAAAFDVLGGKRPSHGCAFGRAGVEAIRSSRLLMLARVDIERVAKRLGPDVTGSSRSCRQPCFARPRARRRMPSRARGGRVGEVVVAVEAQDAEGLRQRGLCRAPTDLAREHEREVRPRRAPEEEVPVELARLDGPRDRVLQQEKRASAVSGSADSGASG